MTLLLLATETIQILTASDSLQTRLVTLIQTENPEMIEQAAAALLNTFQTTLLISLAIASSGALIAGLITSVFLTRFILNPPKQITRSSQGIANGHYDERVAIPSSDELALMATHFDQMAETLEQIESQR